MSKKCIRLYVGDDGEPVDTGEPCTVEHGIPMPPHNQELAPPKFALYKAAAYFTGATVIPTLGVWREPDVDEPQYEASFVLEIITADIDGWERALQLADDLRKALGQKAVLATHSSVVDTVLVEE